MGDDCRCHPMGWWRSTAVAGTFTLRALPTIVTVNHLQARKPKQSRRQGQEGAPLLLLKEGYEGLG
jgi:hypothetical protein